MSNIKDLDKVVECNSNHRFKDVFFQCNLWLQLHWIWLGIYLVIILFFLSCNQSENGLILDYEHKVIETDFDPLKKLQNSFDYNFRLSFEVKGDTVEVFGVLKDGTPFLYNSKNAEISFFNNTLSYSRYSFVASCNGNLLFYSEKKNAIVAVDANEGEKEVVFENVLEEGEHIIGTLYSQRGIRCMDESKIALQIGERNESVNFLRDSLFKIFSTDSVYYFLKTPEEMNSLYNYYKDASVVFSDDFTFLVFPTLNILYKYGLSGDLLDGEPIPGNYLQFELDKAADPLYIHDYTYETTYNIRLFDLGGDKLGLVQRMAMDEYYVHYYSKSRLDYIGKIRLPFKPYYYYIDSKPNSLIFGIPHLDELRRITLDDDF